MKINSQYNRAALLLVAVVLFSLLAWGCDNREEKAATAPAGGGPASGVRKPVIAVTLFPLYSIVCDLVGEWADVELLLPPGASEHGFELTPVQLEQVSRADLLVMVGMNMDGWAETAVKKTNHKLQVLRFAELIGEKTAPHDDDDDDDDDDDHARTQPAHSKPAEKPAASTHDAHHHHGPNNHLWLDPMRTVTFVNKLGERLLPYFPEHTVPLKTRVMMYASNIVIMSQKFEEQAKKFPQKNLVTFHNAFDLLAARYKLNVVAHLTEIEVSPGGEVTPQELVEAINAVKSLKLAVVYAEPQFPDHAVDAIREQTGVKVLRLDPLGNPNIEGYRTYMDMMKSNLNTIVEGQCTAKK